MKFNQNRIIAVLLVFALLIPIFPNRTNVYASGELVDIRFFNAVVCALGITAAGVTYMMSSSFSIPEVDMISLKDKFQTTLDQDAKKKAEWMDAQSKYLAGGVAQTMGAATLAKMGINDILGDFNNYMKSTIDVTANPTENVSSEVTTANYKRNMQMSNITKYISFNSSTTYSSPSQSTGGNYVLGDWTVENKWVSTADIIFSEQYLDLSGNLKAFVEMYESGGKQHVVIRFFNFDNSLINTTVYNEMLRMGLDITTAFPQLTKSYTGYINYNPAERSLINTTSDNISVIPTIPWIDTTVPIGTVVSPAISAPFSGAVPIDVPVAVPIDPTDPTDPTVPTYPDVLSATLAIIAALVPISHLLDNIDVGIGDIGDVISHGLDSIIEGIGDITGTLTGGITSSLSNVQSSLSTLTAPTTQTINFDPVKNIPTVLFSKFPFSIPWDIFNIYNLMATDNRTAPIIKMSIPLSESQTLKSFGIPDLNMEINFDNLSRLFEIIRVAELLLFTAGLIYSTKRLVWS